MHILHIYKDYAPVLGGIENHVRALAEAQAAAGHHVTVLVNSLDRHSRRETLAGVEVIKAGRLLTVASTPFSPAMPGLVARQQPDITHLHFPYPWGELSQLFCGRGRRLVITYHSDVVKQQRLLQLYRPLLWRILRRAHRIIATSPRYVESSPYLSALSERCTVIPLGVDLDKLGRAEPTAVEAVRRTYPGPLLLFVGKLRYYKGLEHLISALAGLPATLLVAGQGPMGPAWRALAERLGNAEQVRFLGEVPDADLPALYAACDLFVLPASQRSEAFGTVLLEAMAAGKPLVTTELGTGTSWVNQHEQTGLVVPPADSAALAAALRRLLADEPLRRRMGAAARARVEAEFSLEGMLQRVESLYRELLQSI